MILTCPACDTKYVVKDDAIPPGGRQVRCASCKHRWHQEPEGAVVEAESVAVNFESAAEAGPGYGEEALAEAPPQAVEEQMIAGEPQPEAADAWIRKPNSAAPFGGKPALERMLSGNVADLYVVRQYLDAQRGGWT